MSKISFKYCPVCGTELDTGNIRLSAPRSIFSLIEAEGKYYSDKTAEELEGHPVRKIFQTHDKLFTLETLGGKNPAGYCKNCDKIFTEFNVTEGLI